jgi:hypothetical protein
MAFAHGQSGVLVRHRPAVPGNDRADDAVIAVGLGQLPGGTEPLGEVELTEVDVERPGDVEK